MKQSIWRMSLSDLLKAIRSHAEPIARHELGHHVVAADVGFEADKVSVSSTPVAAYGRASINLFRPTNTMPEVQAYLRDRIAVLYAGSMAQSLHGGKVNDGFCQAFLDSNARDDESKAREDLRTLTNLSCKDFADYEAHINSLKSEIWERTRSIIEANSDRIDRLVAEIIQRFDGDRIEVVLDAKRLGDID